MNTLDAVRSSGSKQTVTVEVSKLPSSEVFEAVLKDLEDSVDNLHSVVRREPSSEQAGS